MRIKAFRGYRPHPARVAAVVSPPYDVLSSAEARAAAAGNPNSFLRVAKPEIAFPPDAAPNDAAVYRAAATQFQDWLRDGTFFRDPEECLYVYELVNDGRPKTGVVAAAAVQDYLDGRIKKHELTRRDKEQDRARHIRAAMLNAEPVMFAYRHDPAIDALVADVREAEPEYDFIAEDRVRHRLWAVADPDAVAALIAAFADIDASYVADGHHRSAAAAVVSRDLRTERGPGGADAASDYFLAVHFPDRQLEILDYNRLVADLGGMGAAAFLQALAAAFTVENAGAHAVRPQRHRELGMYLAGEWRRLTARGREDGAGIAALGVSILSERILHPLLGIHDLRSDPRIAFVGGARGAAELEARVNSGEMAVAFTLCPVAAQELMDIADRGEIMPPKATWFEPKLGSGLVVYGLED